MNKINKKTEKQVGIKQRNRIEKHATTPKRNLVVYVILNLSRVLVPFSAHGRADLAQRAILRTDHCKECMRMGTDDRSAHHVSSPLPWCHFQRVP